MAASGGFSDCSVHDFDIVCWIVGREVVGYATEPTTASDVAEAGDGASARRC
jgi:predicted dehydrogenase